MKVKYKMELQDCLAHHRDFINEKLLTIYQNNNTLERAMVYSLENGGKRVRPILLLMILESFGTRREKGLNIAIALEMIHTYSLIHDDLPAMDDDDLRRGQPTNHKVFGEAVAILAGDALLTDAFSMIYLSSLTPEQKIQLIGELSHFAGSKGMIKGQLLDMEAEDTTVGLDGLKKIHALKTGALFRFACLAAGVIAGGNEATIDDLTSFANHLGLAFQIQDDILDVEGDTDKIGKTVGSDIANNKSTYVSLLGLDGAKQMLTDEIAAALAVLEKLSADTELLKQLTLYVANRDR